MNEIIVVIDSLAPSFCYYNSKKNSNYEILEFKKFSKYVDIVVENGYNLTICHGAILPCEYEEKIMNLKTLTRIVPNSLFDRYYNNSNVVLSLSVDEIFEVDKKLVSYDLQRCVILRYSSANISQISNSVFQLLRVTKRICLFCEDSFLENKDELNMYKSELEKISHVLNNEKQIGKLTEINVITDPWFCETSQYCLAGNESITIMFNSKAYICPAFFYDDANNYINLDDIQYINELQILCSEEKQFACLECKNIQCKRCKFISKKKTEELNIPPYELCAQSMLEYNISQLLK